MNHEFADGDWASIDELESGEEIAKELDRRAEEIRLDPSATIPWEIVREMR